jgi:hypothetical protein
MIHIPEEFRERAHGMMDAKWQQSRIDAKKAAEELGKLNSQEHKSIDGIARVFARQSRMQSE